MVQKITSVTAVEQGVYPVPDIPIKALLGAIPSHCFERSLLRSSTYIFWDFFVIGCIYKGASALDPLIDPRYIHLPHPLVYSALRFTLWALYTFGTGLFGMGIWVLGHECGHQAFSNSKTVNNIVGFILHTSVGVPYHSWRISHAKHHASTSHMTQEQAYVPHTRSELNLPPLKQGQEDLLGSRVSDVVRRELYDALGDSPLGAITTTIFYLLAGWPAYLLFNTSGQKRYPMGTSHFNPSSPMYASRDYNQVVISTIGIAAWASSIATAIYHNGLGTVAVIYLIPYLWIHHWLVLITFLQHTDPILPHYRAAAFTFSRGALSTLDRSLMGDCGSIMAWLGAHATHGLAETHVLHHVCSKIPHYHAWEASAALKEKIAGYGLPHEGRPIGWCEFYRVLKECKFVEDEGDVVFFKNEEGVAVMRPAFHDGST
ncbi:fatty acid desaturase [Ephemerocybe angulata]|uniref:Fatty acid desaturase n=1 Tax=Ephemerocybe angulata TaxID=980116 RepID=A0A8H6LUQ4_9AGAR|nr:fatty acid desaturase [Tulosesus angulatus]